MYDFYVQKWTEEATLERKQGEDIQAANAKALQAQLQEKEKAEKPPERLTSRELMQKFIELEAQPDNPQYKELLKAFAEAKQREEEANEVTAKQVQEDKQQIEDEVEQNVVAGAQEVPIGISNLSDQIAEGSLIPDEGKYVISNVDKIEKLVSDKDIYELEKRLLALEGRNIVQETQAKYEEALQAKAIDEKYRLATKLNANKGEAGTIIGNTLKGFFELSQSKERPTNATVKNINDAVKEIDDYLTLNKGKVFTYESFTQSSQKTQRGLVRLYALVLILEEISKLKSLKTYGIDRLNLDKKMSFGFILNESIQPIFDKISAILYKTVASQKLVKKIKDLNDLHDIEFGLKS